MPIHCHHGPRDQFARTLALVLGWLCGCAAFIAHGVEEIPPHLGNASTSADKLPIVAIVPGVGAEATTFSDLLLARLSTFENRIGVVERAEMQKLRDEKVIQSLENQERPLALARLSNADGLVFVECDRADPNAPRIAIRLTDCTSGVIHRSVLLAGGASDLNASATLAAQSILASIPHLTKAGSPPPLVVTLLGLRPSLAVHSSRAPALNTALGHLLMNHPEVEVVERWKVDDVGFERSIAAKDIRSLKPGTNWIDGNFDLKDGRLLVSMRIRAASSEETKLVSVEGDANDQTKIIQSIAEEIFRHFIGTKERSSPLDTTREAIEFGDLAQWLLVRKLGAEAVQAFESAIALGDTRPATWIGRLQAYAVMIQPEYDRTQAYLPVNHGLDGMETQDDSTMLFTLAAAGRLAGYAQTLMESNWHHVKSRDNNDYMRYYRIRCIIRFNLQILHAAHFKGMDLRHPGAVKALREATRLLYSTAIAQRPDTVEKDIVDVCYLTETPSDALEILREMLAPKYLSGELESSGVTIRSELWDTCDRPARLSRTVAWGNPDRAAGDRHWRRWATEQSQEGSLLKKADSLAFEFQDSTTDSEKTRIFKEYIEMLEQGKADISSTEGQRCFVSFLGGSEQVSMSVTDKSLASRFVNLVADLFDKCRIEPTTFHATISYLQDWPAESSGLGIHEAERLFQAVERYGSGSKVRNLSKEQIRYTNTIKTLLKEQFPQISKPPEPKAPIQNAVPISIWNPAAAFTSTSKDNELWVDGQHLVWDGTRLLMRMGFDRLVALNPATMQATTFPFPDVKNDHWSMAASGKRIVVCMRGNAYLRDESIQPISWVKLRDPNPNTTADARWCVGAAGGDFYFGSQLGEQPTNPQLLIGRRKGETMEWMVSSQRRPADNLLDTWRPRSCEAIFEGKSGKVFAKLSMFAGPDRLIEITSKTLISSFTPGILQVNGERVLEWYAFQNQLHHIISIDPADGKPTLLFRDPHSICSPLGGDWEKIPPLLEISDPAYRGDFIAPVYYGGKLWLLKWQDNQHRTADSLRLVMVDTDHKKATVIPLSYQPPPTIKPSYFPLESPEIEPLSFVATTAGLFFTPKNETYYAPVVLYIPWTQIQSWISRNEPHTKAQQ